MERNQLTEGVVTTISETGIKELNGKLLHFIPVACYVYTVGENTINQNKSLYGI